jgi:hypothetical protein
VEEILRECECHVYEENAAVSLFFFFFLYGCDTWSLALREKNRLRVFENRVLRGVFGPKRRKRGEAGEDCIMRSFIMEDEMGGTCRTHGRDE